jgi:hypothetical protein
MAGKKKPKTSWEIAKPILLEAYLAGVITDAMKPSEVWPMRQEFHAVEYKRFVDNFARMKRGIRKHRERASADEAGFLRDMAIHTLAKDIDGYWDGSLAQELLRKDLEEKTHEQMRPKEMWLFRPEYQEFGLKTFRDHIHQELRSERETNYWLVKRKKKKKAKEDKQNGKSYDEDEIEHLYDPVLEM